jgi:hypothetical protein
VPLVASHAGSIQSSGVKCGLVHEESRARPTASSYAARRLGQLAVDCRATRRARHCDLSAASRVSISELLGSIRFYLAPNVSVAGNWVNQRPP